MTIQSYTILALIATNIILAVCLLMLPRRRKIPPQEIADALEEISSIKTSVLYSKRKVLNQAAEKLRDQASDIEMLRVELWCARVWRASGGYQPIGLPGNPKPPSKEN